jgi:hypothetical protein
MSGPCDCGGKGLGLNGLHYAGAPGCRIPELSIYVAGASADRALVAGFLAELRRAGWTVTYDWTTDPGWTDPTHPRATSAMCDVEGVRTARVFWYVAPEAKSEGSHFELGAAVILRDLAWPGHRQILMSGPISAHARIFPMLGNRHFAEHATALAWLIRHAQETRAANAIAEWVCRSCGAHKDEWHRSWCEIRPASPPQEPPRG